LCLFNVLLLRWFSQPLFILNHCKFHPTFICIKDCFVCPELCYKYSCTDILKQFMKGLNITADQKKVIRKACYSFYDTAAELLQSEHSVSISVSVPLFIFIIVCLHLHLLFSVFFFHEICANSFVCPFNYWLLMPFISWQSLRLMEHENSKILNAKGELSEENLSSYEKLRKSYDHLYRNVSS